MPEVQGYSKDTISSYAHAFAIFFQFLSDKMNIPHHLVTYKTFTVAVLDEYILWLKNERGYTDSSVCQRMAAINSFLRYVSRREVTALKAYSAASNMELPNVTRTEFPYFTKDEMALLLSMPNPDKYLGSRDLVLLSFLYDTAARSQEVCNICVRDIRFGSPTKVRLLGKRGKIREIPVSEEVSNLLRYHLNEQNLRDNESKAKPLFSSQTNEVMTPSCIRSIVAKYVKLAKATTPGLYRESNYSPHSFRHSKAVHMVEAGISIIYIRNFLGHANIESTEIYARVGQEAVNKALSNRQIPRLAKNPPCETKSQVSLPDFIINAR